MSPPASPEDGVVARVEAGVGEDAPLQPLLLGRHQLLVLAGGGVTVRTRIGTYELRTGQRYEQDKDMNRTKDVNRTKI